MLPYKLARKQRICGNVPLMLPRNISLNKYRSHSKPCFGTSGSHESDFPYYYYSSCSRDAKLGCCFIAQGLSHKPCSFQLEWCYTVSYNHHPSDRHPTCHSVGSFFLYHFLVSFLWVSSMSHSFWFCRLNKTCYCILQMASSASSCYQFLAVLAFN